jgi:hypothetical protein
MIGRWESYNNVAIIDPDGLFSGERLAACSDEAQLYWPRLFLAANSCARLELSYTSIISGIFKNFRKPPKVGELWAIFEEYEKNFLAILYEANGAWWCQFITSEKYLPKYRRTRDVLTPAPSETKLKTFNFGYLEWKKANSFSGNTFRNSQKVSDGKGREGIGEGVGVGEESTFAQSSSELHATPIGTLPCIGKYIGKPVKAWPLYQAKIDEWQATYPGVNVVDELRKARQWLIDNPAQRKTYTGMPRFLNRWLAKEQDRGGSGNGKSGTNHQGGAVGRVKRTISAWDRAIDKRLGNTAGNDARADVGGDAESGIRRGDDGRLPDELRGSGAGIRSAESRASPAPVCEPTEVFPPSGRGPRGT